LHNYPVESNSIKIYFKKAIALKYKGEV